MFDRVTGEPIWPIVETKVLESEVPGEVASPTQPIPTKPAPYSQQGLEEDHLVDYTPEIKAAALKLAQACRMGPFFIPPSLADGTGKSGFKCSWYAPGASGGVNIDGGAAADPETGTLFVASQSGLSTIAVQKDPCSEFRYSSVHDSCGQLGALPPPRGYKKPEAPIGGFARRSGATMLGTEEEVRANRGVSILKPNEIGGITAYNLSTGDKAWWAPNGGQLLPVTSEHPMFKGVKLPPQAPTRGHAQAITTKTLLIYGTGRSGGPPRAEPQLHAVDKATGKTVGSVKIPSRTSAVPMTFLHKGKQYIVFATGAGANTSLVALAVPDAKKTTSDNGR